jgi:hypothetical protein
MVLRQGKDFRNGGLRLRESVLASIGPMDGRGPEKLVEIVSPRLRYNIQSQRS